MDEENFVYDPNQKEWVYKNQTEGGDKPGWFASGGSDLLGSVISIIPSMTEQFNSGYQQNQLGIANANARAAEANAASVMSTVKNNWPWILGIVIVIAVIIIMMNRKNN